MVHRAATAVIAVAVACTPSDSGNRGTAAGATTRSAIAAQIRSGIEATRNKNVDQYLDQIPDEVQMRDAAGNVLTREALREQVTQAWTLIERTRVLDVVIDTIIPYGDSASVVTVQHWDRLVRRPGASTADTVISIKRQRELWKRTPKGWRAFQVTPLGGTTTINGELFEDSPPPPGRRGG
jgi:hypothetical protein